MKPHHYNCAGQVVALAKNLPLCGGDVMPRTRPRFRRAIIVFSLAALGVTAFDPGPAFSQTPPPPVTLKVSEALEDKTGVFEPDLVDLNVTPELKNAIKNASWSKCYPPRATFKVVVKRGGDPLFL